jgi:predicted transcriptional regulator YdeE
VLTQIPYRASEDIYAVYTDYTGDSQAEYTVLIGARVTATENTPRGMMARSVRAGRYAVFTSNPGCPEIVVPEMWRAVWADSELVRAYLTDFEVYDAGGQNPEAAVVRLYVGIK